MKVMTNTKSKKEALQKSLKSNKYLVYRYDRYKNELTRMSKSNGFHWGEFIYFSIRRSYLTKTLRQPGQPSYIVYDDATMIENSLIQCEQEILKKIQLLLYVKHKYLPMYLLI